MTQITVMRMWLFGIAFLFVCILVGVYFVLRKKNIGGNPFYVKEFVFGHTFLHEFFKIVLWCTLLLAMIALLFASMGISFQRIENREYVDDNLLFLIDISPSMSISDIEKKSRIDAVIKQFSSFLDFISGPLVGVIVFADTVRMVVPFSRDYAGIKNVLSSIEVGSLGNGSAISDAILYSINVFSGMQSSKRKLIIITDGLQNSGQSSINDLKAYKSFFTFPVLLGHIGFQKGGVFKYKDFTTQKIVTGYVKGRETSVLQNIGEIIGIEQYSLQKKQSIRDFFHSIAITDFSFKIRQKHKIVMDLTNVFLFIFYILSFFASFIKITILRGY